MKDNNILDKRRINRPLIATLLFLYLIVLLWVIVFKCNVNYQLNIEHNLSLSLWERFTQRIIPFQDFYITFTNNSTVAQYISLFFNTICCIPGGVLLAFFFSKKQGLLWSTVFILCVEVFQLFSGWGGFDPTDVFLNVLGVYIGYLIFYSIYKRISDKAINVFATVIAVITVPIAAYAIINTALNFPI